MEKGVVCSAVLSGWADGPRVVGNERKEATTLKPGATRDTENLNTQYWDALIRYFHCNPWARVPPKYI
jgi:hypothetical protein